METINISQIFSVGSLQGLDSCVWGGKPELKPLDETHESTSEKE